MLACKRSLTGTMTAALRVLRSNQVNTLLRSLHCSLKVEHVTLKLTLLSSGCCVRTDAEMCVHTNRRRGPHRKDTEREVPVSLIAESCGYIR